MTPDYNAYKKSSFGPAFLFLDKKRRGALAVYYAFCRLMDDLADEPGIENRLQQLAFWREEIAHVFEKKATTALGKELEKVVADFALTPDRFLWLIEGMEADVQGRRYLSFADLEWYLWRVAGIVGLATLDILGIKGSKAKALAYALGSAVQTTNIIRDIHEDAALGRVYIPQILLEEFHLTAENILTNTPPEQIAKMLSAMALQSRVYYAQADAIMNTLPARKMLPCRVMGLVYGKNLAKIEKKGFLFTKTIKLSKSEKIIYGLCALLKAPIF